MASAATTSVDAHLDVDPEREIAFVLNAEEASPRVTLKLTHPDPDSDPVAFKVKTTQPRRYLVRPNQGLIQPGATEEVQILLVEKDKNQLLQQYNNMGDAGLAHCKDKFLVQSIAVDSEQAESLQDYEKLTNFWVQVQSNAPGIANKKLQVKHRVDAADSSGKNGDGSAMSGGAVAAAASGGGGNSKTVMTKATLEGMDKEPLVNEYLNLKKKYDELVSFSVNLTAERDLLNNSLEQTKRDLQREINQHGKSGGVMSRGVTAAGKKSSSFPTMMVFFVFLGGIFLGLKLKESGLLSHIRPYDSQEL